MMLAANGRESEAQFFLYFLAEQLHKTLGELEAMPHDEYVGWMAYYEVKNAMGGVRNG